MKIPAAVVYIVLVAFTAIAALNAQLASAVLGALSFAAASVMVVRGVHPFDWLEFRNF